MKCITKKQKLKEKKANSYAWCLHINLILPSPLTPHSHIETIHFICILCCFVSCHWIVDGANTSCISFDKIKCTSSSFPSISCALIRFMLMRACVLITFTNNNKKNRRGNFFVSRTARSWAGTQRVIVSRRRARTFYVCVFVIKCALSLAIIVIVIFLVRLVVHTMTGNACVEHFSYIVRTKR